MSVGFQKLRNEPNINLCTRLITFYATGGGLSHSSTLKGGNLGWPKIKSKPSAQLYFSCFTSWAGSESDARVKYPSGIPDLVMNISPPLEIGQDAVRKWQCMEVRVWLGGGTVCFAADSEASGQMVGSGKQKSGIGAVAPSAR